MPQLNPHPWFLIMISSWLIFLLIMQPKTSSAYLTNHPSSKTKPIHMPPSWSWPWT
uniref:ATP synthase complex subunit 8 n=1 Tax=Nothocercus nigrocapillus TaxID=1977171 RepID=A0A7G9TWP3_9AVES|nr:ATP synthase F0 subunit 8 [Nothocercus nigrocapillus]QNN84786.1 ATP synthase F0 subunit 8 [Nothocercus nigrocapillus]